MPDFAAIAVRGLLAASLLGSVPAFAASQVPAHKTVVKPVPQGVGCMDNSRYVSHVAYIPSGPDQVIGCGHLLSTDTLLSVKHWDKT